MSRASDVFGKIVIWLLVIVLIVGVAFVTLFFVMREKGMTYYVEYNGKQYFAGSDGGSLALLNDGTHNFSVKSLTGGEVNYSVKVVPNSVNNFRFSFDNELHMLYNGNAELDDYSEAFGLEKRTDGFSLTLPDNFTVEQAIETKYGGDVVLQDEVSEDNSYFVIVVSTDKNAVDLWFNFANFSLTLTPPQIIF